MHDWLTLLEDRTDRFASVVAVGDPSSPVAHCPGWTLRDLTDHLGGVHQWAAHAVVAGTPDGAPEPATGDLAGWYSGHAAHLLAVLAERPADASAWTMDPEDRTAGFWRRRQVHETVVHLWDAELAVGTPTPLDPALAWDGVLEVVDVMYPRQVRLGRVEPPAAQLRLVPIDLSWSDHLTPTYVAIGDGQVHEVQASAEVLLRLLWHRADPEAEGVDPRAAQLLSVAIAP